MRRSGMTLWEVLAIVVVLSVGAALFWPLGRGHSRYARERYECQSNLKQISLAVLQYVADNGERFPSLNTVSGWRVAISPYLKKEEAFQCPSESVEQASKAADYWFNARMSGVKEEVLEVQALTVMLGDGYSSADPRTALSQLPKSWLDDTKSPAWRHLDGANYAFADGHVKWLKPQKITLASTREDNISFALK